MSKTIHSDISLFDSIVDVLRDMKSVQIVTIDFRGSNAVIFDRFIIASGSSKVHIRSIADKIQKKTKTLRIHSQHIDGLTQANWIVMDYGNIIIHIFHPEYRDRYQLEKLWESYPITYL